MQTNKQAIAFQHLWSLSERQASSEDNVDPKLLNALLDVSLEADLQREIRDIIDELDIVLHIVQQQQDMITRFKTFAEQIMGSEIRDLNTQAAEKDKQTIAASAAAAAAANKEGSRPAGGGAAAGTEAMMILRQQKREFEAKATILLSEVADRIKEIDGLKKSAESTAQNVRFPSLFACHVTNTALCR